MPAHRKIPIDDRLSHLTHEEYSDLFSAYHHSEIKTTWLIDRFNLNNISSYELRKALALRELYSNSCTFHNLYAWQKARGRNKWSIPFCPECKSPLWSNFDLKNTHLYCNNSSSIKEIKTIYTLTIEKYLSLSYKLKVILITWFIESIDTWPFLKSNIFEELNFFPSNKMYQYVIKLFEEVNLFPINEISDIKLNSDLFEQLKSANYYLFESGIDVFNFWWDLCFHENINYFIYELDKKNIPSELSETYLSTIKYLTTNLPIQQAMFAIWASIKDSCSVIAEKNWDLDYASKIIPENLKKKADRLIDGSMNYYPFNRPFACPQSKISRTFSEMIFEIYDGYFTNMPSMKIITRIQEEEIKKRGIEPIND